MRVTCSLDPYSTTTCCVEVVCIPFIILCFYFVCTVFLERALLCRRSLLRLHDMISVQYKTLLLT